MSPELELQMLEFIDESKAIIRQRYYGGMRDLLSPTLRGEVACQTHGHWVKNVTMFSCDDANEQKRFTVAVADRVTIVAFGKSEVVVAAGAYTKGRTAFGAAEGSPPVSALDALGAPRA